MHRRSRWTRWRRRWSNCWRCLKIQLRSQIQDPGKGRKHFPKTRISDFVLWCVNQCDEAVNCLKNCVCFLASSPFGLGESHLDKKIVQLILELMKPPPFENVSNKYSVFLVSFWDLWDATHKNPYTSTQEKMSQAITFLTLYCSNFYHIKIILITR